MVPFVPKNRIGPTICNRCVKHLFMLWVPPLKYIIWQVDGMTKNWRLEGSDLMAPKSRGSIGG